MSQALVAAPARALRARRGPGVAPMNGFLLFLIILNAYILLVYLAARSGLLARFNIGLMGPALMIRTQHGKGIIDQIARLRSLWITTGTWGIVLTLGVMFGLSLLLVAQVPMLFRIPADQAPGARDILALPGINPLIPISYGIVALIVAIVIHEFAHGVLARAQDLKVKSLGLLYLIVPIGAFVEPDDEELMAASRRQRMKVYAAGPTSNLVTALLCGLVFSGLFVAGASPIDQGVGVSAVVEHGPAEQAGLAPGMLLTQVNGSAIHNYDSFQGALADTRPGQEITVETARHGSFTLCLGSREEADRIEELGRGYDFCRLSAPPMTPPADNNTTGPGAGNDPDNGTAASADVGFLGVNVYPLSPADLQERLAHPVSSLANFVLYIALPFTGYTPMDAPLTDFYETPWGEGAGGTAYWIAANLIYWIMWISLMLGLTNALPAVPLDGGFLFRDFVDGILARLRKGMPPERRAFLAKRTSITVSLVILALILLQFLAPRIAGALA